MKRFISWQVLLALSLISLSVFFYLLHYAIFKDAHHIFLYLIGDIAFLFLDVLIVMLVLHRLLVMREKQSMLKKLNMVIGTFFSEVGADLLRKCAQFDRGLVSFSHQLIINNEWTSKDFLRVRKNIGNHVAVINSKQGNLAEVRDFLVSKRQFLLSLLENSNLLEHESFTNLLWAVFHLTDELSRRCDIDKLPENDYRHLSGDIQRVYQHLILQWLDYMRHLQLDYPYLFSLAIRTNPFDQHASVEIP
ncbi:MAG: hypothetical protein KBA46_06710 [Candidatus Omnitrophica bacterium]|nr:hypothetical protein [Candidatus Omnitrophota bacterium]